MCLPPCAKRILYHRLFRGPRPESAMDPQGNQTVRNQIQPYVLHFSEVLIPNNSRPQGVRTTPWWAGHCCPAYPHFGRVLFGGIWTVVVKYVLLAGREQGSNIPIRTGWESGTPWFSPGKGVDMWTSFRRSACLSTGVIHALPSSILRLDSISMSDAEHRDGPLIGTCKA